MSTSDSCRPPSGTTYLTIGQDLFSIYEYALSQYNASLHVGNLAPLSVFTPAATMVYTSIFSIENGTSLPTDYGSGIEYADGILNSIFPDQDVGLQIGLWLEGSKGCDKINAGMMSTEIKTLANYLEGCQASKVFLRIGYEFDNPSFGYSDDPESYKQAFRIIVTSIREQLSYQSLSKVKFVWHSWAAPRAGNLTLNHFYPGDEYVDWVGISIFQQLYDNDEGGNMETLSEVLNFATLHEKPTMIAESTPFGGISSTNPWDDWFQKVLDLIEKYDISMWSYIDCDWESQPMWHNVGFGETRIATNQDVMEKWQKLVLSQSSRFLTAGSLVNCGADGNDVFIGKKMVLKRMVTPSVLESDVKLFSSLGLVLFTTFCVFLFVKGVSSARRRFRRYREYNFDEITFLCKRSEKVVGLGEGRIVLSQYQGQLS